MTSISKLAGLSLLTMSLAVMGCDSGGSGEAAAPPQDELTQFLEDNPDVANAVQEEPEDQE